MSGMSEIGRRPEGLTGPESNIVKNAVEQGTERMNPAVLADLEGYGKKMKPSVLADLEGRTKKPELSMQNSLAEGKEKIKDVVINAAENIPIKALRPEVIQTYNQNLEGQVHPNADVRYGKSIFMFNGKIMEGVFPRFHVVYEVTLATVYKGNIIKNLIMDCQSYTKYRPNETTGGIFVSWRRKEELPTGA